MFSDSLLTDTVIKQGIQEFRSELSKQGAFTQLKHRPIHWPRILQYIPKEKQDQVKTIITTQFMPLFEFDDYPVAFSSQQELCFHPRLYAQVLSTFPIEYIKTLPMDQQRQFLADLGLSLQVAKDQFAHIFTGQETITLSLDSEEEEDEDDDEKMIDVEQ